MNREPIPSNPSNGNGEAVWGSFWSALEFWSELFALLWSALVLPAEAAFWSLDPGVVLAGGFCAVVLDEAEAEAAF